MSHISEQMGPVSAEKFLSWIIFTALALWVGSDYYLQCMSVCLSVPLRKTHFPVDWRLLVKERIAYIGMPKHNFSFFFPHFQDVWRLELFIFIFQSLRTSLRCIMGDLAGVGSVLVAVGISDRWHVKSDMWRVTCDNLVCQKCQKGLKMCKKMHMMAKVGEQLPKRPDTAKKSQKMPKGSKSAKDIRKMPTSV